MKAKPNCIACTMKQARIIMDRNDIGSDRQVKLEDEIYDMLFDMDMELTPGHYFSEVLHYLSRELGVEDFYIADKKNHNRQAMDLLPMLKGFIDKAEDKLLTALLLSAAGNIIDLGVSDTFNVEENIERCLKEGFEINDYERFKKDLLSANKLLLVADNAGEIVFDRLLVEQIQNYSQIHGNEQLDIKAMVKDKPVLNDATMSDAVEVGLTDTCEVITSQCNYIGAPLELIGPDALNSFKEADIIIAKGQGNYETLGHEKSLHNRLYILLQAKCQPIASSLAVDRMKTLFQRI